MHAHQHHGCSIDAAMVRDTAWHAACSKHYAVCRCGPTPKQAVAAHSMVGAAQRKICPASSSLVQEQGCRVLAALSVTTAGFGLTAPQAVSTRRTSITWQCCITQPSQPQARQGSTAAGGARRPLHLGGLGVCAAHQHAVRTSCQAEQRDLSLLRPNYCSRQACMHACMQAGSLAAAAAAPHHTLPHLSHSTY
jgi:hypothetical protein